MAAKLGHKVCVVDSKAMVGGVCVNTGTIPSKTLREAVLYLTGMQLRDLYGASYRVKEDITISDLLARLQHVIGRETEVIRSQLMRNHIELIAGLGELPGPAHALDRHRGLRVASHPDRGQDRHRHRHHAGPTGTRRLRRRPGAGLRSDPDPGHGAGLAGGGRRRA